MTINLFRESGLNSVRTLCLLVTILFAISVNCGRAWLPPVASYYYVYYQNGFPFGYVGVTDFGRRVDTEGSLHLIGYSGLFRFLTEEDLDWTFNILTAFRDDRRIVYLSYDDGTTTTYIRFGDKSVHYASICDNRIYSTTLYDKPAFFRTHGVFMPFPLEDKPSFYPQAFPVVDMESGAVETVRCRFAAGNAYLAYRGYTAGMSFDKNGNVSGFVASDGTTFTIEAAAPDDDLTAFRQVPPAVALPLIMNRGGELTVPLSVCLSAPVNPGVFGDSFSGECLGGRADGIFKISVPARSNFVRSPPESDAGFVEFHGQNDVYEEYLYCCGLALTGGNLLYAVYWREKPGEPDPPRGSIVLARSKVPIRITSFYVTDAATAAPGGGYVLAEPAFSVPPKHPLIYSFFYSGDEVGFLEVATYKVQDGETILYRSTGELFGKEVGSSCNALLVSKEGFVLRPALLTPYRPEEFLAIGATLAGGRVHKFPHSFCIPVYSGKGFEYFELESVTSHPVGPTSETCFVYDCGGTRVGFNSSGVPVFVERNAFSAVLSNVPELTRYRTFEPISPSSDVSGANIESARRIPEGDDR
jgi:hypothetical protein